jgi:hypothetical protein|nr:MAG TPA: Protein of unknown function (DUF2778) [Caudoviricetes sp.]
MKLVLERTFRGSAYTIGKLYVDGDYFCDTLEDVDRGLSSDMPLSKINEKKVYGETAIPTGTYKVVMNVVSPKFKDRTWAKLWDGKLPRLENVPGYEGVLIHVGNKAEDTLGCILVGQNKVKGQVINSTATFDKLMDLLTQTNDITIKIY